MSDDQHHLNDVLQQHMRRLRLLERQAALLGHNAPAATLLEIEDLEMRIALLRAQADQQQLAEEGQVSDDLKPRICTWSTASYEEQMSFVCGWLIWRRILKRCSWLRYRYREITSWSSFRKGGEP